MLTLRLLAAARHAYQITADGVVADAGWTPAPYGYVGYTDLPQGVQAGANNQDAGFTATIAEGVVVAIRGTTPPGQIVKAPQQVVIDWVTDAVAALIGPGGAPPGFPGKVHLGFYQSFMRLWQQLGPAVHAKVDAFAAAHGGARPIFVTGHSKGGAITALVAWRLKLDYPDATIVVRSFAGARIGDDAFAAAYNAALPDHVRYEYDQDVVPHLPLSPDVAHELGLPWLLSTLLEVGDLGYGQVGRLQYIQASGVIVGDSAGLEDARIAALIARAKTGDFAYIAGCHAVDPPNAGYFKADYV